MHWLRVFQTVRTPCSPGRTTAARRVSASGAYRPHNAAIMRLRASDAATAAPMVLTALLSPAAQADARSKANNRISGTKRLTSDKPQYGVHDLALLHEIRTYCVVRKGHCHKIGCFLAALREGQCGMMHSWHRQAWGPATGRRAQTRRRWYRSSSRTSWMNPNLLTLL